MLILGLRDYIKKSGFNSVVFGSSGGIDSAVIAALACDAIGAENVYGIRMPSIHSSDHSLDDAKKLQKNLQFNDSLLPIKHIELLSEYNKVFAKIKDDKGYKGYNDVADQNMQARIRGAAVMHASNAFGMLPLSTGNKSELSVGYCTIYGDMCGGFAPINDVYKTIVYALAEYFNKKNKKELIPVNIIRKPPSAELAPDQKDDDNLLPYEILDPILYAYIECYIGDFYEFISTDDLPEEVKVWAVTPNAKAQYDRMISLVDRTEFKRRQAAPGIKVSKVSFGTSRRVPIVFKKR
jgi:NAD+ synthase (glutamine-hydrolysing)